MTGRTDSLVDETVLKTLSKLEDQVSGLMALLGVTPVSRDMDAAAECFRFIERVRDISKPIADPTEVLYWTTLLNGVGTTTLALMEQRSRDTRVATKLTQSADKFLHTVAHNPDIKMVALTQFLNAACRVLACTVANYRHSNQHRDPYEQEFATYSRSVMAIALNRFADINPDSLRYNRQQTGAGKDPPDR